MKRRGPLQRRDLYRRIEVGVHLFIIAVLLSVVAWCVWLLATGQTV